MESYYDMIYQPFSDSFDSVGQGRPLFGVLLNSDLNSCTRENLMTQLQTAIQLEWATIPTYLTSLYSIVDGCNNEIYQLIRSVIIQEMLHMTQAANMLIAMNGSPLIDDASVTPSFPTHLPGGVLPGLVVHLDKLSLQHVYNIFMAIELPEDEANNLNFTIGAFYGEISRCIEELSNSGQELFDATTLPHQVKWPWEPTLEVGAVQPITDSNSAIEAIRVIVAQGEGVSPLDPDDIGNITLAHFYKFEEIVCQHRIEKLDGGTYSYTGEIIPFDAEGVWPMRCNPTTSTTPPHTNCYTESRVFHTIYRNFLRKLQEVFNGKPEEIFGAIKLMESLQVHAKKLMWTKFNPFSSTDDTTCGPVWDYDWPLPPSPVHDLELIRKASSCYVSHAPTALLLFSVLLCIAFI